MCTRVSVCIFIRWNANEWNPPSGNVFPVYASGRAIQIKRKKDVPNAVAVMVAASARDTHIPPELFRFCNNTQKNSFRIIIFAKHAHIHVCAHYIMPMCVYMCVRSRLYEQFFGHFKWNNKAKRGAFNRRRTANNINGPDREKKREERRGAHVSVCAVGCVCG